MRSGRCSSTGSAGSQVVASNGLPSAAVVCSTYLTGYGELEYVANVRQHALQGLQSREARLGCAGGGTALDRASYQTNPISFLDVGKEPDRDVREGIRGPLHHRHRSLDTVHYAYSGKTKQAHQDAHGWSSTSLRKSIANRM